MRVAHMRPSETTAALSTAQLTGFLEEDPSDAGLEIFERRGHAEHKSPEHALAFAVLLNACDELVKTPVERRRHLRFQETFAWFMSDEVGPYPFSFRNLCDYFNLDAEDLRRGLHVALLSRATMPARAFHLRPRHRTRA